MRAWFNVAYWGVGKWADYWKDCSFVFLVNVINGVKLAFELWSIVRINNVVIGLHWVYCLQIFIHMSEWLRFHFDVNWVFISMKSHFCTIYPTCMYMSLHRDLLKMWANLWLIWNCKSSYMVMLFTFCHLCMVMPIDIQFSLFNNLQHQKILTFIKELRKEDICYKDLR
jgi:hypothetical protein